MQDNLQIETKGEKKKLKFQVLNDAFYDQEYVCIGYGIDLPGTEEIRNELSMLVMETTKDGISLLAREKSSDKIVGFSFNKLQVCNRFPNAIESQFEISILKA